jgi:uracil-DNA glycosylase family 4
LTKEIEELKPRLILSLGKPASSFLLKRDVRVKSEHGKIFYYNENTAILVMLHPSGIDRQMDRSLYMKQLTSVLIKLKENKLKDVEGIFK